MNEDADWLRRPGYDGPILFNSNPDSIDFDLTVNRGSSKTKYKPKQMYQDKLNKKRTRRRRNPESDFTFLRPPSWEELKSKRWESAGAGVLGLLDTGIIGWVSQYALEQVNAPETVRDFGRILSKFGVGSLISCGINDEDQVLAGAHQIGVYVNTGLDIFGTVIKHAQRNWGTTKYQVNGKGYTPHMKSPLQVGMTFLGLGELNQALEEKKIVENIETGGIVVAKGENGEIALASALSGEIIVSGPADTMKGVVESVRGFALESKGTEARLARFPQEFWGREQEQVKQEQENGSR